MAFFRGHLPMKRLLNNMERIIIYKFLNVDLAVYDFREGILGQLAIGELLLHYDYSLGFRIVMDFEGFSFSHLQKSNPFLFMKAMEIAQVYYTYYYFSYILDS